MKDIIFRDEVKDFDELINKLSTMENLPSLNEVKVGVICFIFDKDGNVVMNRRGPGARDDVGKLQALGGSVNDKDLNFRDSMKRELKEEAGVDDVNITNFVGAIIDSKYDRNSNKMIDWIILCYKGIVGNQELVNMEPERCIGFERINPDKVDYSDMGDTAASFLDDILKNGI